MRGFERPTLSLRSAPWRAKARRAPHTASPRPSWPPHAAGRTTLPGMPALLVRGVTMPFADRLVPRRHGPAVRRRRVRARSLALWTRRGRVARLARARLVTSVQLARELSVVCSPSDQQPKRSSHGEQTYVARMRCTACARRRGRGATRAFRRGCSYGICPAEPRAGRPVSDATCVAGHTNPAPLLGVGSGEAALALGLVVQRRPPVAVVTVGRQEAPVLGLFHLHHLALAAHHVANSMQGHGDSLAILQHGVDLIDHGKRRLRGARPLRLVCALPV